MQPSTHRTAMRTFSRLSMFGDSLLTVDGKAVMKASRQLPIVVGTSFFRRFTCVDGCHVCCTMTHSLEFSEAEWDYWQANNPFKTEGVEWRRHSYIISTNGRDSCPFDTISFDGKVGVCPFLTARRPNGGLGCTFWPKSPIECAAAVNMRVMEMPDRILITKQPMSRAWRYNPSPECQFDSVPIDQADLETNIDLLLRYYQWAEDIDYTAAENRLYVLIERLRGILDQGVVPQGPLTIH